MKSSPLLVECLHVCQQQSSLWKCFRALGTLACLQLITMLACSVLLILPFHVKNLMAFFAGKTPAVGCIAVTTAINMCARLVYYCGVIGLCPLCRRAPPPHEGEIPLCGGWAAQVLDPSLLGGETCEMMHLYQLVFLLRTSSTAGSYSRLSSSSVSPTSSHSVMSNFPLAP